MKKFHLKSMLTTLVVVFFSISTHAQESKNHQAKNELKIDAFDLIAFTAIEITYERLLENDMSYGISAFANFRTEDTYHEKFSLIPFFRFYFLDRNDFGHKGYFVELFSKFASGDTKLLDPLQKHGDRYFDINLGVALGKKWITKKGMTFEVSLGFGRNLGLDKNSPKYAIRGGFSLGYRF